MNRRSVLASLGTALGVGTAGCSLLDTPDEFRLAFVRVFNGSVTAVSGTVRVHSDDDVVYTGQFEDLPSFQDVGDEPRENRFAGLPNAKVFDSTWPDESGVFEVSYRLSDQASWQRAAVETVDAPLVAFDLSVLGGGMNAVSINHRLLEFQSEDAVQRLLGTNETEDATERP
ncbi:hypothetical protein [Haloarchaeobius iranensis]|uniref:hypothetical protein n=1 Tax=Haloarchaeobius iranensis TaxID=996166 RepID=UPI001113D882|nr:hypothetical protein [Haloarchaeobius iranensis]